MDSKRRRPSGANASAAQPAKPIILGKKNRSGRGQDRQKRANTKHQTPNTKSTSNAALRRSRRRSRRSFNQAPNSSCSGNFDQKGQILAFAFAFAAVPAMGGHHVLAIVGAATATHPNIQSLLQIREAGASAFDLIEHISLAHPGAHAYDHFRPFPCEASWRRLALTKQRE